MSKIQNLVSELMLELRDRALVATTDWVGPGHESPHRAHETTADWAGGGKRVRNVGSLGSHLRIKALQVAPTFFGSVGATPRLPVRIEAQHASQ